MPFPFVSRLSAVLIVSVCAGCAVSAYDDGYGYYDSYEPGYGYGAYTPVVPVVPAYGYGYTYREITPPPPPPRYAPRSHAPRPRYNPPRSGSRGDSRVRDRAPARAPTRSSMRSSQREFNTGSHTRITPPRRNIRR